MKTIFQKWWDNGNKQASLMNYKDPWATNGVGRIYRIRTNGAKKQNGDTCLDFFVELGYWVFNYTNFNLQGVKP